MIQTTNSPLINGKQPPTIKSVNKLFMDKGVELAVKAAKDAIEDWGGDVDGITHLGELGVHCGAVDSWRGY
jgi:3-oxoacyl-(acyl-carrier-protein) synthase